MSLLPTAHAGQSFGSRRIDYFTVSGEVSSSDAGTGRVTDGDGVDHEVRLIERTSAFAKGDTATVLRVQSGPNRRSRPVAIVNHSRELWMRAAPDATSILARAGVTRTLNWWLSVLALALVAVSIAWPSLHVFLTELNGTMMAGVPSFDIYAELGAGLPGLASWRLETALSPGLFDGIAALGFVPMEQLTEWGLAIAVAALTLVAFFVRSWRLVYVPALAVLCVFSGAILGNPVVSLAMIGGAVLLFIIGGFINRVRDAGRFNARVERLAEYVLRHPPEEGVRSSEPAQDEVIAPVPLAAAAAATAIAAASAVAEGDEPDAAESTGEAAILAEDDTAVTDEAAAAEPADSGANGEVAAEAVSDEEPADDADAAASLQETDPEADDDLPSLEAVAAAAALTDIERSGSDEASGAAIATTLDDDRTMAVAAPPPMPAAPVEAAPAAPASSLADPETSEAPEPVAIESEAPADEPPAPESRDEAAGEPDATENQLQPADEPTAPEVQDEPATVETAATDELASAMPAIDDPLIEDDGDPMMERASGDFAPGAPDIEIDREPAE